MDSEYPDRSNPRKKLPNQLECCQDQNDEQQVYQDDKQHRLSNDFFSSHISYLENLEQQGKSIPDSCSKCLKDALLIQQQIKHEKSETNLGKSSGTNGSQEKCREKYCSFFDLPNANGVLPSKRESNVKSPPPDITKADCDKSKDQVSDDKSCDCDKNDDIIIKRINESAANDRTCFIVKRKKCKHELAKEKKSQPELVKPNNSCSVNQNQPIQRTKPEQCYDNVDITKSDCSYSEPYKCKTDNVKGLSSTRKCQNYNQVLGTNSMAVVDQDCNPVQSCVENKNLCSGSNKVLYGKNMKGKRQVDSDSPSESGNKICGKESKPVTADKFNGCGQLEKNRPCDKKNSVGCRQSVEQKSNVPDKGHCGTHNKLMKKQPSRKELEACNNLIASETVEQGKCPDEDLMIINEKAEAIMRTREIVWGNNVPPELIIPNTSYAIRHADCCVGNKLIGEFEYVPRYICPKYGAYAVSACENENISRSGNCESNRNCGQKPVSDDRLVKPCHVDSNVSVSNTKTWTRSEKNQDRKGQQINAPVAKESDNESNKRANRGYSNRSKAGADTICDDRSSGKINRGNCPNRSQPGAVTADSNNKPVGRNCRGYANRPQENSDSEADKQRFNCYTKPQKSSDSMVYNKRGGRSNLNSPCKPQVEEEVTDKCLQNRATDNSYSRNSIKRDGDQLRGKWSPIQRCDTCDSLIQDDNRSSKKKCSGGLNRTSPSVGPGMILTSCSSRTITPCRRNNSTESNDEMSDSGYRNRRECNENCANNGKNCSDSSRDVRKPDRTCGADDKDSNRSKPVSPPIQSDNICSEVTKSLSNCCELLTKCLSLISEKEMKNNGNTQFPTQEQNKALPQTLGRNPKKECPIEHVPKKPSAERKPDELFCSNSNCNACWPQQVSLPTAKSSQKRLPCVKSDYEQPSSVPVSSKDSFHKLGDKKKKSDYTQTYEISKNQQTSITSVEEKYPTQDDGCCDCDSCQCRTLDKNKDNQSNASHSDKCCMDSCDCTKKCKKTPIVKN